MNFTMKSVKAYVAIVALVIGVCLLIKGAYMMQDMLVDIVFIAVGAVLTLSYFWLIGDTIERWLRASPQITFMPLLLVLGLVILVFGLIQPGLATATLRLSLVIPGLVLAIVAVLILFRSVKK